MTWAQSRNRTHFQILGMLTNLRKNILTSKSLLPGEKEPLEVCAIHMGHILREWHIHNAKSKSQYNGGADDKRRKDTAKDG